jgi:TonB family protein
VIRERIGYNWSPPALFGQKSEVVATVYFKIARDGSISDEKVENTSSHEIFDRAAIRAVKLTSPLPPLPAGFKGKYLGVHFEFQHTPG